MISVESVENIYSVEIEQICNRSIMITLSVEAGRALF